MGIEPTHDTADAAREKGIETIESFLVTLAQQLESADLVIANNVLAHVPDINDFVSGIARILKPTAGLQLNSLICFGFWLVINLIPFITSILVI